MSGLLMVSLKIKTWEVALTKEIRRGLRFIIPEHKTKKLL